MVRVIDPETDCVDQHRDNDSQPDHHHLHNGGCTRSQRKSQGGGQKPAAQSGEELEVGDSPHLGDMLDVSEDRSFIHGCIAIRSAGARSTRRRDEPTGRLGDECIGQKAEHDSDDCKDERSHRIVIALA